MLLGAGIWTGTLIGGPRDDGAVHPDPGVSGVPQICVNQPFGDGYTDFVIHGVGFVPKEPVTVEVDGAASPDHPTADREGTFNYVIDQGHYFFHSKPMKPGFYQVVVTAPGGINARTPFRVYSFNAEPTLQEQPQGPPPTNGQPPGGQPGYPPP